MADESLLNASTQTESRLSTDAQDNLARQYLEKKYGCAVVASGPDAVPPLYYVKDSNGMVRWAGSAASVRAFVQGILVEKRWQWEHPKNDSSKGNKETFLEKFVQKLEKLFTW